ncbi:hypothetical protein AB0K60_32720 [Thermopolyspora sp. NPDC052614]|uniref:hypothetical protein n=1 Tax=Thermopolyspora sp. NPDC052614 TaxID=3155682 RepID=UPI00341F6FD3
MHDAYQTDPVIGWDRDDKGWLLRERRTGIVYRSGSQLQPEQPTDSAYLGRLMRPDGKGTFLAIAGICPNGSLGVVQLLANSIAALWGKWAISRSRQWLRSNMTPQTGEPVKVELASPLYRHEE